MDQVNYREKLGSHDNNLGETIIHTVITLDDLNLYFDVISYIVITLKELIAGS